MNNCVEEETVDILERDGYEKYGRRIRLHVDEAIASTRVILPPVPTSSQEEQRQVKVQVQCCSTLKAAEKMIALCHRVTLLNFACARVPGGMFGGKTTRAQEESLCRCTSLISCLKSAGASEFYRHHGQLSWDNVRLASDAVVLANRVAVFRDADTEMLLDEPYFVSVVSCAAVHASGFRATLRMEAMARKRCRSDDTKTPLSVIDDDSIDAEIEQAMRSRIAAVLAGAAQLLDDGIDGAEHPSCLILGAFGCGVFGNPPSMVARLFAEQLARVAPPFYESVIFAIQDDRSDVVDAFSKQL
jgi:uncharacterized protein (TIGR02452 family)